MLIIYAQLDRSRVVNFHILTGLHYIVIYY